MLRLKNAQQVTHNMPPRAIGTVYEPIEAFFIICSFMQPAFTKPNTLIRPIPTKIKKINAINPSLFTQLGMIKPKRLRL